MSYYYFKYRRFLPKKIKAIGHKFHSDLDRMDVFCEDGSLVSIPKWSQCYLYLGSDWVLYTKKQMEKEAGQVVPLNISV